MLPVTGALVAAPLLRVSVKPGECNELQKLSRAIVDKAVTIKHDKVEPSFGCIDTSGLIEVERCLAVFLGIAK